MRLGVQLACGDFAEIKDLAQAAEGLGYASVYFPDHFIYEQAFGGFNAAQPVYEAGTVLAAVAMATSRVRIGTHVLCNGFRHPALTAKVLTTLDHVSGGRLVAGLGAGWTRREFAMMGLPFPDVSTRLAMLDEALRVILALWTEERASMTGLFYGVHEAIAAPKPLQRPHPPLMLGGNGKGVMRLAARYADVVNVAGHLGGAGTVDTKEMARFTRDAFCDRAAFLAAESRARGRATPRLHATAFLIAITESPFMTARTLGRLARVYGLPEDAVPRMPSVLIGTPEELAIELRRREHEDGLGELTVGSPTMKLVRRLAEEVLPHV